MHNFSSYISFMTPVKLGSSRMPGVKVATLKIPTLIAVAVNMIV